ncbi:hypothetical protein [Pedobacter antarcticus]|uniref:hypothetical protein n=1 Tax=Pedobacter antarcticus TaxID=34086 RepID=UPI00292EC9B6|nr:hypothetical protein [Pedobacter antarcticus]
MINTEVVAEMLQELRQNQMFAAVMRNRARVILNPEKRAHFLNEMIHAQACAKEIEDMLVLEYEAGISITKVFKDIQH